VIRKYAPSKVYLAYVLGQQAIIEVFGGTLSKVKYIGVATMVKRWLMMSCCLKDWE
jgi:anthranilate/para-aminobenzoate synthase component II